MRLADPATGFNANLESVASDYGIAPFVIDWSDKSKQFFQGFLAPDDLDETTASKYPMVMLFAINSANQNFQKFALFSGVVVIGLDFHLSWRATNAKNFEDLSDAVEDAAYATLNGTDFQAWGAPTVAFNGEVQMQKRPLEMAGEHWRQTISFRLTFQVDTH